MSETNYMQEVFAPAEAKYRAQVLADTWGHLAPSKNKTYRGYVVFALGCFGSDDLNPTVLACEFGDLESSPWLYDALIEFLQDLGGDAGEVFRFDGTFRNYTFKGKVQKLAKYGDEVSR